MEEIKLINGNIAKIIDTPLFKALKSDEYNYLFNKKDGFFVRWGKGDYTNLSDGFTMTDLKVYNTWCSLWNEKFNFQEFVSDLSTDGNFDITVPEIVDWEISEKCSMGCSFCYKSNVKSGRNITFDEFKESFHKLPPSVTTIAFGIGSIDLCPDLWNILDYTKQNGIIPTITINGDVSDEDINNLTNFCGAVAVSVYDKDISYNTVKKLTDNGLTQCNLHVMISEETFEKTIGILNDVKTDERLSKLRSVVLLSLKEKGRSVGKFNKLSQEKFDFLFQYAIDNNIGIGFDSCSAAKAFNFVNKNQQYEDFRKYIEPCEATKYSAYINVNSEYFPCSFTEGTENWESGISLKDTNNFMEDIWFNNKTLEFGNDVTNCRNCNIGCSIFNV